ncbi:hypothetical protein BM526_06355 [Alteromonas mediterranea]|uniref:PEP-CTERM sorting domain-containing protein n=1 Tax=Alteromonas mediterranea TaxID=314275 RepID=A0AAC9NRA0_9ALTE|nr:hypothetical protein [Alteromonas mediterranea]APD89446.1 hypothetical protein BM524_06330 [Alteromonas mediterranea]APE01503.1 hypothetical protein BM526_06355 [Alteromonas mediterranea]
MKHSCSKYGLVLTVLLCILSLSSSKANAALITSAPVNFPAAVISVADTNFGFSSLLDEFSLSQASSITKITFWSLENPNQGVISDFITLRLFKNEPGFVHDSPLFSATGASGPGGIFTKEAVAGVTGMFLHEIELVNSELEPGDYFLNIGADLMNNNGFFGWANAATSNAYGVPGMELDPYSSSGAVNSNGFDVDLAFQIEYEPVVQANAPSALSILSLGLILMLVRRRV